MYLQVHLKQTKLEDKIETSSPWSKPAGSQCYVFLISLNDHHSVPYHVCIMLNTINIQQGHQQNMQYK